MKKWITSLMLIFALATSVGCTSTNVMDSLAVSNGTLTLVQKGTKTALEQKIITYDQALPIYANCSKAGGVLDQIYPLRHSDWKTVAPYFTLANGYINAANADLTKLGGSK